MLEKAKKWRDRISKLSTESGVKDKDFVLEHLEIIEWLIKQAEKLEGK